MDTLDASMRRIKDSMRAAWTAGDFGVVAKTIARDAEAFAGRLNIPAGARVLDVACGSGNLAIPLARAGAAVTGVDIAANLLIQARQRAAADGLPVRFDEGDAEELPYADDAFDAVVTMFGAMFAPRPEVVASELARVLRSGGLLAMANWNPGSFTGRMFKITGLHVPPPPGVPPSVLWGDDATVHARLKPYFRDIQTEVVPIDFDLPTSPAGTVAFFREYFGPTKVAFGQLTDTGQAAYAADLEELWTSANAAADKANRTFVQNEYLAVTATRL
jgi:ubiquinone/menaquinone biosynthesis C-methylase UbiE